MENELQRLEMTNEFAFKIDADIERCMEMIDTRRQTSIYHHPSSDCTTECKERGAYNNDNKIIIKFISRSCLREIIKYYRMWKAVGNRWYLESQLCSLYVSS